MENVQIIDNYLEQTYFNEIARTMISVDFPWFIAKGITNENDNQRQFFHYFYDKGMPFSNYFKLLEPMLVQMQVASLIRIKANLLPQSKKIIKHPLHKDQPFKCKVGVFYMNNCNGGTRFEDGTFVESVANRMAIFDNDLLHEGTTCTNAHERIVINFNFFGREPL